MQQFITKLGKTRAGDRTRIWIEGDRLTAAGFHVGNQFGKHWTDTGLALVIKPNGARDKMTGTVSGKGTHPIIDVTGAKVAETFSTSHVLVTFTTGRIDIVPHDPIAAALPNPFAAVAVDRR